METPTPKDIYEKLEELKKQVDGISPRQDPEEEPEGHPTLTAEGLKESYKDCPDCRKALNKFMQDDDVEFEDEDEDAP